MTSLQEFYMNSDMCENVKAYLIDFLEKEAIKKVFAKEDVSAVAEAKDIIDKAFENLAVLFAAKPKKNIINEAR